MMSLRALPWILLLAVTVVALAAATAPEVHALPEYAVQTGEPCATCHLSPSGGGPRTPRGLAWVAGGKLSAVPDLSQALEALGVHRQVNQADYVAARGPAAGEVTAPAQASALKPGLAGQYSRLLRDYDGN